MNSKIRRLSIVLLVIAILAGLVWKATRPKPIKVVVHAAEMGQVESTVTNTRAGTVKACHRAQLAPPIGGQIARLHVKKGDEVKADQILLELWNDDLAARVKLAKQESLAARARAEQACVVADVAEHEAQRAVKLRKKGLASDERADTAVGDAKAKRAACKAAQVTTRVSMAQVDVARAVMERTILRAPFDGIVAEINGELGEFVTPSPVGVPTLPAVDITDNRCMYVTAPIDEVDASAIRVAMPTRITLDAFPDRSFSGQVRRVASYVQDREKQARTVDIEVTFNNPEDVVDLLPGYSADAEIILQTQQNILRIPTEAILQGDQVYVYLPDDEILQKRTIKTGISNWQVTQVISGLKAGDLIVTSVDRKGVEDGVSATPEQALAGKE